MRVGEWVTTADQGLLKAKSVKRETELEKFTRLQRGQKSRERRKVWRQVRRCLTHSPRVPEQKEQGDRVGGVRGGHLTPGTRQPRSAGTERWSRRAEHGGPSQSRCWAGRRAEGPGEEPIGTVGGFTLPPSGLPPQTSHGGDRPLAPCFRGSRLFWGEWAPEAKVGGGDPGGWGAWMGGGREGAGMSAGFNARIGWTRKVRVCVPTNLAATMSLVQPVTAGHKGEAGCPR